MTPYEQFGLTPLLLVFAIPLIVIGLGAIGAMLLEHFSLWLEHRREGWDR